MPNALQIADGDPALVAAIQRARKLLHRRALAGAATSAIPIPGLGWVADAALLSKLVTGINAEFGLTPEQLGSLSPTRRGKVEGAAESIGSTVIGKFVTTEMARKIALSIGKRMLVKQAARFVPLGGQAVSALIGYQAMRSVGETHIRDCVQVCKAAGLKPPAPVTAPPPAARRVRKTAAR
jgi:hypothetical protein